MDRTKPQVRLMCDDATKVIRNNGEAKLCSIAEFHHLVELHLVKKLLATGLSLLDEMAAVN